MTRELDKIRRTRVPERGAVTKMITVLENELKAVPVSRINIESNLRILDRHLERLTKLDQEYVDVLLDTESTTDEIVQAESDSCFDYTNRATLIRVKTEELLQAAAIDHEGGMNRSIHSVSTDETASSGRCAFRLPKPDLKKFAGELSEWINWWSSFEKINQDTTMSDVDKFYYLDQSMVKGSKSAKLVSPYPNCKENYKKAVEALKKRFGNPDLLSLMYTTELLSMVSNKTKDKFTFSSHVDSIESNIQHMEILGLTVREMTVFLYPMVLNSLPEETVVAWQRSANYGRDDSEATPPKTRLDFLRDFLQNEVENVESRGVLCSSKTGMEQKSKQRRYSSEFERIPTAAGLFSGSDQCTFCDNAHSSQDCFKAQKMSDEERRLKLKEKGACWVCLRPGHLCKDCTARVKWTGCKRRHFKLMCRGAERPKKTEAASTPMPNTTPIPAPGPAPDTNSNTTTALNCTTGVMLKTLVVTLVNPENRKTKKVRVFVDDGSQRSYILKQTVKELAFDPVASLTMSHNVFGGGVIRDVRHHSYRVTMESVSDQSSSQFQLIDQEQICGILHRPTDGSWKTELEQRGISLNDADPRNPSKIEILIGADLAGTMMTGNILNLKNGMTAVETRFGWCLMGQLHRDHVESNLSLTVLSMTVTSACVSEFWSLDVLGIRDPIEVKTKEERELLASEFFSKTVTRKPDGRYCASLPWVNEDVGVPSNKEIAEIRLKSTTRRLMTLGKFTEYDKIFRTWEDARVISRINPDKQSDGTRIHYLPHRAVIKLTSKTTPMRPVFDASCKVGRTPSLNEILEKGPNLLEVIPAILHRFRLKRIGVTSDIRKAFLQVEISESDRDAVRFLWWEDPDQKKLITFRHNRAVFGMNCSPFLLGAVINHHLTQYEQDNPEVVRLLRESLYVDNCVVSVDSVEHFQRFREASTKILSDAMMDLTQWEYTGDGGDDITSVLGLKWDKRNDTLFCSPIGEEALTKVTKRLSLSKLQQVFDPVGFLSPILIIPKLLLQRSWKEARKWDDEVKDDVRH